MIDEHAVQFALKYLDECRESGEQAHLVMMLEYVDYYDRMILNVDEANEVLKRRPDAFFTREEGRILFNWTAGERELNKDDLIRNIAMYEADFWERYTKLQNEKKP